MPPQKKVGIFGGTFNPIHNGHLHFAEEMQKALHLEEIWFVPALINPLKLDAPPIPLEHRLAMVAIAIKPFSCYKLIDIECRRKGPSYTIQTLRWLRQQHPDNCFYLLIGDDNVSKFHLWRSVDEIIRLSKVVVGARVSGEVEKLSDSYVVQALASGWTPIPILEVSSTEVRRRLEQQEDCSELLPKEVCDYILEHHLFNVRP